MDVPRPAPRPFWETKALAEMSPDEWEALCDGCGRCCLLKLEDEETGEVLATDVACRLLDHATVRCRDYAGRHAQVPACLPLTPERVASLAWLPPSCAYRRLDEGAGLAWWHPLVSGDPETVRAAGVSVRGRVVCESEVSEAELEDHVADWPLWPVGD